MFFIIFHPTLPPSTDVNILHQYLLLYVRFKVVQFLRSLAFFRCSSHWCVLPFAEILKIQSLRTFSFKWNLKFFGSIYELIVFFTLADFCLLFTWMSAHVCSKLTQPLSLHPPSSPLPPTLGCFCMVPGCLEAVCICMGEMVDRDGIWHAGTRSKRSIWSHKNRREPSSHPYKNPHW